MFDEITVAWKLRSQDVPVVAGFTIILYELNMKRRAKPAGTSSRIDLSIVVPVYNESAGLAAFFERTQAVLDGLRLRYEIICVDDGSSDQTVERIRTMSERDPRVKCLVLSRNFGKDIALSAGLDHARGEMIVPTDADLQDPPELIPDMIHKLREGYDVVYMRRSRRLGESFLKKITASLFYRILARVSEIEIPRDVGDFRIFNRRVLKALITLRERRRFMRGLFNWVGFRQTELCFTRAGRASGLTRWSYYRLFSFAIEGITSFTIGPLRICTAVGVIVALCSALYGIVLAGRTLVNGADVPGYASLLVAILFMGSVQLITTAVLCEYVGSIFQEVKGRPLYVIRDTFGDLRCVKDAETDSL